MSTYIRAKSAEPVIFSRTGLVSYVYGGLPTLPQPTKSGKIRMEHVGCQFPILLLSREISRRRILPIGNTCTLD